MVRLFLSGQTTCALLLGAGLLLRAQAALMREGESARATAESPRTQPAEMFATQTVHARAPRVVHGGAEAPASAAPGGNAVSHAKKARAQRQARRVRHARGVRVASKALRRG